MAILKIARMGHPVLRQVAEPVADPVAPEIRRLVADMKETLADADGAGLAAPQVHVPLRIALFRVPASRAAAEGGGAALPLTVLMNPVIEPLGEARTTGLEACLSVPGLGGLVPRPARIRYRGIDEEGQPIEREASGFHARVVQHECDHLDGILYLERMDDLSTLAFMSEIERDERDEEALLEGAEP